jgi:NTP pyrophosphatase (non-canonical NTP hydrolase)
MTYREEVSLIDGTAQSTFKERLIAGGLGLVGEAGEVADLLKKYLFHGKELNREELIAELGDVRWYLEHLCVTLKVSLEDIESANVAKLKARYPNGFVKKEVL